MISGFLKTSLRNSNNFHGYTSITISAVITTYLALRDERLQREEKLKTKIEDAIKPDLTLPPIDERVRKLIATQKHH